MDHKYEIEVVNFEQSEQDGERYWIESEIAMLTGLEMEEIYQVTAGCTRYSGQWRINTFRKLGFNTNPRWVKFDKNTKYPCMMRCSKPNYKKHWYSFIYYDGHIYDMDEGKITWAEWNAMYPNYRVTSMLQVWI